MRTRKTFKLAAEKFLTGNYTPSEAKALAEWQQADPVKDDGTVAEDTELQDIKVRMLHQIQTGIAEVSPPLKTSQSVTILKSFWTRTWIRAAGILTLAAGLGWAMYFYADQSETQVSLVFQNSGTEPIQRTLPDGSIVWLNSQATLSLAEGFNQSERNVFLRGEAFFKVAKDSLKPFTVHTGEVVTRVLGTSFNVKTFTDHHRVEVSVTEGKVSVSEVNAYQDAPPSSGARDLPGAGANKRSVVLLANQRAVFTGDHQPLVKSVLREPEIPLVWKDRALVFNGAPVGEVIVGLNNRFAAHIQTESESMKQCRVKVDLSRRDIDTALRILCQLINAECRKVGDQIILTGEGCPDHTTNE